MLNKIKNIANTEDKKRLLSNFFSLSVLQVFTYILPLLTLPYLVRVLGVENFGLVMFAQSFIMFFNLLVDYGFNLSATREISFHRDDKDKLTEIFSSVMAIKFILIILSFIVLSIIIFSFEKFSTDWELYYLTFLWVVGQALFPIWYFQGLENMKYVTIINIISKLIFTALIFIFIQNKEDYLLVPILNGLGFIVGGLYSMYIIKSQFKQNFVLQNIKVMYLYFKDSSQFFLSRVSVSTYTFANAFILGLFTNNTMVGYYSIASKLYGALQGLYQPVVNTIYPYMSKSKNKALFKKIFIIVVSINIIMYLILFIFSKEIIDILFNLTHQEVIIVFKILVSSSILLVPALLLGYPFLAAMGYPKYANLSIIYVSICHISALIVLALLESITIYSVAIMVLITEGLIFFSRLYFCYKTNLIKFGRIE